MKVTLKLLGPLTNLGEKGCLELRFEEGRLTVGGLLEYLAVSYGGGGNRDLASYLSPPNNLLILKNGVEAGSIKGLETAVEDGDTIVLIPTVHGG